MVLGMTTFRFFRLEPAGRINEDPQTVTQRAAAFAAGACDSGPVTLIVMRDEVRLHYWVALPESPTIDAAAKSLAHCVAARLVREDSGPDLSAYQHMVRLSFNARRGLMRSTQHGVSISEMSKTLSQVMSPGTWVAVSLRHATSGEDRRYSRWLSHRLATAVPTHHSLDKSALIASFYAAGPSRQISQSLLSQVAASLPGFDIPVIPVWVRKTSWFIPQFALAFLGVFLLAVPHLSGTQLVTRAMGYVPDYLPYLLIVVAGLWSVLALRGILPTAQQRLMNTLRQGRLPAPARLVVPPRKPCAEHTDKNGKLVPDDPGQYPLAMTVFKVGSQLPVSIVAPHGGALAGDDSTKMRDIPPAVLARTGPMVGYGHDNQSIYLSAADSNQGIALLGRPSSGKSHLSQHLMAFDMIERVAPAGTPTFTGAHNAIIDFESKPDGADEVISWAHALGDQLLRIDVANPSSYSIDMFAVPGDVARRAEHFVNAMHDAFNDGAIQAESFRTLKITVAAGLAVPEEIATAASLPTGRSPIYYAAVLMGKFGDNKGVFLASQIRHAAERAEVESVTTDATVAWEGLLLLYGDDVRASERARYQRAPGNKLDQLLTIEHFFNPSRSVTWQRILTEGRAVVICTDTDSEHNTIDTHISRIVSAMLLYTLRASIQRLCVGWEKQNKWVSVYCDELLELVGSDPDTICWLRERGRSYGVRPRFATQYLDQLPPAVAKSMISYPTVISFTQGSPAVARPVVDDLDPSGASWSVEDLMKLKRFHAVVRTNASFSRQDPFVMRAIDYSENKLAYRAAQGYGHLQEPAGRL